MVARVLFAVWSPIAISSCSLTRESCFSPVAGLVTQEEIRDATTQRRKDGKTESGDRRGSHLPSFLLSVFPPYLGHNHPNVPAVSSPQTTASTNDLTVKLVLKPYQIACGAKPNP